MSIKDTVGIDLGLTENEKSLLLKIARTTIEARINGEPPPEIIAETPALQEKRGAFVSLHAQGNLRGCIGYIIAEKPLYKTIQEMAIAAAFKDPRFEPLSRSELDGLAIEISVLTPMKRIADSSEIEAGKHGIMITKGYFSGLLLPQVATEYGWGREKFLAQTCIKAGLQADAWKEPDTNIFIFSADVF
ncbi:MAG: AmmeMemoRadiSam system protein A [Pseudomonadota bacterium]